MKDSVLCELFAIPLTYPTWEFGSPASEMETPSPSHQSLPVYFIGSSCFEGHCSLLPFSSLLLWETSPIHMASTTPYQQRRVKLVSSGHIQLLSLQLMYSAPF